MYSSDNRWYRLPCQLILLATTAVLALAIGCDMGEVDPDIDKGSASDATQPSGVNTGQPSTSPDSDKSHGDESAADSNEEKDNATREVARVKVMADGTILLNEEPATLEQLKEAFAKLAENQGQVWYYREVPEGDESASLPPAAHEIMTEIIKARLPIRLSTKPDFSDSVGPGE